MNSLSSLRFITKHKVCTSRLASVGFSTQGGQFNFRPYDDKQQKRKSRNFKVLQTGITSVGAGALLLGGMTVALKSDKNKRSADFVGSRIDGLPEYTMKDVAQHDTEDKRIWVTYKNGVYDITDFIPKHPGADKIMMAAGGAVEPFWNIYAVHKKTEVNSLLEDYRIGNLNPNDVAENTTSASNEDNPWANEPQRHHGLRPTNLTPYNAETPLLLLADNFYTPNELFYVRNHLPVPTLDEASHTVDIELADGTEVSFSLEDLKTKFPKTTITATIQCGGNRRADMNKSKPVAGLAWEGGAIGNATWSGARLIDVLKASGLGEIDPKLKHVHFEGADVGPDGSPYGASIPIEKATSPWGDVILAYEMNSQPLSRDHGYPLRVIVPGNVASRSVKWLQRIIVAEEESQSHWQQKDYKVLSPSITDNPDFSKFPAIQTVPVTSAICEPKTGSTVAISNKGSVKVKGYAYSGGGNGINRVDISVDGGKTWAEAELDRGSGVDNPPRSWAWVLWKADVPVSEGSKEIEIWSRAIDSSNNSQPDSYVATWNLRGLLANAVSKVSVKLQW